MNSAFRALWLVHSEVISQCYSPPSKRREIFLNFRLFVTHKITLWSANYSACVVCTKTVIHLSVGESDGNLPRRFAAITLLYIINWQTTTLPGTFAQCLTSVQIMPGYSAVKPKHTQCVIWLRDEFALVASLKNEAYTNFWILVAGCLNFFHG